ncbi:type II toxin-antitoxin system RelE/ParE family toxin [Nocardia cyriacigeorgica]|uniref:type II toxin-antitoxin system RelE/ParE family toxin n=1 Tax=Nocardia cyriacigeorgica TaxID=135487 RepID=UPI001E49AC0C|nr:type II toxin-antitoxin system RelE/ParE family toxin [Nocardia cyriacigeorgica]
MDPLYSIEIEPEVRAWLESLPAKHFLKVEEYVGLLADHATTLGEPFSRHLGEGVRELRPTIDGRPLVSPTGFVPTGRSCCSRSSVHGPAHDEFFRVIEQGEL